MEYLMHFLKFAAGFALIVAGALFIIKLTGTA